MTTAGLRFAAADPGGANVIAAFLRAMPEIAALAEPVWTMPVCAARLSGQGIEVRGFDHDDFDSALTAAWRAASRPAALVTGTSITAPFEAVMWRLAEADGVPTLAWLDQWTNLGLRFRQGRPGWVAAIDARQRAELIALDFSADRVLLAGQPYLFPLSSLPRPAPDGGASPDGRLALLYVSEPYSRDYALDLQASIGFDEFDVFDLVYRAARLALERAPRLSIDLAVKLHPYEAAGPYRKRLAALRPPPRLGLRLIDGDNSGRASAASAHLLVGVSSVLLLEGMLLGKPVLSLRPGLKGEDPFAPSRSGDCLYANDIDDAVALLVSALTDPEVRARALCLQRRFLARVPFDCAERVRAWLGERAAA